MFKFWERIDESDVYPGHSLDCWSVYWCCKVYSLVAAVH